METRGRGLDIYTVKPRLLYSLAANIWNERRIENLYESIYPLTGRLLSRLVFCLKFQAQMRWKRRAALRPGPVLERRRWAVTRESGEVS